MMYIKKVTCLFLAGMLLQLVSCTETNAPAVDTTETVTTTSEAEKSENPAEVEENEPEYEHDCYGCPLYYKGDAVTGGFYYWENDSLCYTTSPDIHTIQYCATCDIPPENESCWYPLTTAVEAEADCTHDGYRGVKCICCGGWKNVTITPALGHDYVEIRREEPTCVSKGKIVYQCSHHHYMESLFASYLIGCAEEKTEELSLTEHRWKFDMATLISKCEVCGTEKKIKPLSQYDPDWEDKPLVNDTIGKSGCLLTALTMKYNFDKNKNYTPYEFQTEVLGRDSFDDKARFKWGTLGNKLEYSYSTPQDGNDSLTQSQMSEIYKNVSSGNPVVLGLKNEEQKQHYYLVVGYNGSDTETFNAGDFMVINPGNSKQNLGVYSLKNALEKRPYVRTFIW